MKQFTLFAILSILFFSSCDQVVQEDSSVDRETSSQEGDSSLSTRDNDYKDFNTVSLGTSADVVISKGPFSFSMEGPEASLEKLDISVRSGNLRIKEKGYKSPKGPIRIQISMPELTGLSIGGSGDIRVVDEFTDIDELDLSIGGSGNIQMELEASSVEISIGGSGKIDLAGYTQDLEISIGGSGDVQAYDLEAVDCEISMAGGGEVYVYVTDNLEANIVGGGDVHVKGNPEISGTRLGGGKLIKEN